MEVVKYEDKIYLVDIIDSREDESSISYNRTYAFYDYDTIKKLEDTNIFEEDMRKNILFTKYITGTKLPFEKVNNIPPIQVETKIIKLLKVKVAKPVTVTKYEFN